MDTTAPWRCRVQNCGLCRSGHRSQMSRPSSLRRSQLEHTSMLGRREVTIAAIEDTHVIGQPLPVKVTVKHPARKEFRLVLELIMRVHLHRDAIPVTEAVLSVATLSGFTNENTGKLSATIQLDTTNEALHPCGNYGMLVATTEIRAKLAPRIMGELTAIAPVFLVGSTSQQRRALRRHSNRTNPRPCRHRRVARIKAVIDALPSAETPANCNEQCSICLEPINNQEAVVLPCLHKFHASCAKQWLLQKPECPLCKHPIV